MFSASKRDSASTVAQRRSWSLSDYMNITENSLVAARLTQRPVPVMGALLGGLSSNPPKIHFLML
ncbi:hypothetical protein A2U01_0021510 [Trifolium medium]|uniref:Uncharacterized protein n=1 Tax=Trifolium medium TaxID=97028 RepID=A0A392NKX9_9FABA|nr:hypothetical protein [Trifolium medium]